MAQVKVQIVVDRKQVDELDARLTKLNNRKITINTKEATDNIKQTEKATQELLKTQQQQAKANEAAAKAEREIAKATTEQIKARKELVRVETEKERKRKAELQTDQQRMRNQREAIRLGREEAKAQQESDKAGKQHNETVKKQGLLYDILGRSVSSFIARMTIYRAVYAGIRAITSGFSEALETLKAVDDELVTVRKVTGFDAGQMANVEKQAYAVASKYGVSAADYTNSVATFARAGYKELSGDLAELAEKTVIVGDTTADVAQQFLLSVDAAYKYEGNIQKLSAVLDGMNELDNNFATSIEKIAEGMGIVAPVAAQMNVSIDELAAGIGTITAVTQRSGTEAARALRAIFLNIVGDTKTEIEEGVTWTTGEIEGLRDVIKLYAKDAYDAAQASGGIIDPMEAIAGLSKSVKDGVLSEAKLMEMVSDIGGKLRTSQLLAIVQNWGMYEDMLAKYKDAYGSADKEIENAMDSWSRKSEVLKNTWTEFIKTSLNSDVFKTALDLLTSFVERLGTLLGVVERLAPILVALKLRDMAREIADVSKAASGLAGAFQKIGATAKGLNIAAAAIGAIGVAWSVASYLIEDAKRKREEVVLASYEEADSAKAAADNVLDLYVQMDTAAESTNNFADEAKNLAAVLRTDIPESADEAIKKLREMSAEQLKTAADAANTALIVAGEEFTTSVTDRKASLNGYGEAFAALPYELQMTVPKGYVDINDVEDALAYRDALQGIIEARDAYIRENDAAYLADNDYYKAVQKFLADTQEAYDVYNERKKKALETEAAEKFQKAISDVSVKTQEDFDRLTAIFRVAGFESDEMRAELVALAEKYYPQFTQAAEDAEGAIDGVTEAVEDETDALNANQKALGEDATASERAAAAKKDAEAAVHKFIDALVTETGELTANATAAFVASSYLADLTEAELNARNEAAKANYAALRAELAGVSTQALRAASAILAMEAAYLSGENSGIDMNAYRRNSGVSGANRAAEIMRQMNALEAEINSLTVATAAVHPYTTGYTAPSSGKSSGGKSSGGSSGGKSSSSSASTEDTKLTSLKNRVSLLKSELSLMQARGDSEAAQIAKMREIQEAIKKEYQYLESIKGDQITINGLYEEWYKYASQIEDIQNKTAEEAERQAEAYQAALDAQIALQNLLKNRSVRVYNASTGQWEWQTDPTALASAQEAAHNAMANLTPEQRVNVMRQAQSVTGYGLNGSLADFLSRISGIGGGTNNYGNTYNLGGISLSEAQARAMTIFDLAQLSNNLAAYA